MLSASQYLLSFILCNDKFTTGDIQDLSERSISAVGFRLASPSSFERMFRRFREDGIITVKGRKMEYSNQYEYTLVSSDSKKVNKIMSRKPNRKKITNKILKEMRMI